jgi:hypothetical protein
MTMRLASSSRRMMVLLIWSPMSLRPFSATMSAKLAPCGIWMGAKGWQAYLSPYLSLTYLMNSITST